MTDVPQVDQQTELAVQPGQVNPSSETEQTVVFRPPKHISEQLWSRIEDEENLPHTD